MKLLKVVMYRKIPEDEIRVKGFFIMEVRNHPNVWVRQGSRALRRPTNEDWQAILHNMQEAFKNDPELLAKYKLDTMSRMKDTWKCLLDANRREWYSEIEKGSASKLQTTVGEVL